jgi:hypothetical protein
VALVRCESPGFLDLPFTRLREFACWLCDHLVVFVSLSQGGSKSGQLWEFCES